MRDIDRLSKVLQAQKAAFQALEEEKDNEDPRDYDLMHDAAMERQADQEHEAELANP